MRLTEEGNLGIGTTKPKFKLDVAGPIRARQGFVFKDGSTLNVNDKGALTLTSSNGSVTPSVAGSGTLNQIAKWTPDGNTLGNSNLTEASSTTLSGTNTPLVGVNATINNTGSGNMAFSVRGATLAGPGEYPTGLDVAPTFAPSANIALAQGFTAAAFSAPPSGVTITDQFGGNSTIVYNNTLGAVTNGTNFNIASPFPLGALKPTTQTGIRIRNQGMSGTTNSYGLYVDSQSGSTNNNYSAIFAGGNVGIGTTSPVAVLHVIGTQPPPVSFGNGTDATSVFFVNGGAGGNTPDTNVTAGTGANMTLKAGDGGLGLGSADLTHASGGGAGGSITLRAGDGGSGNCIIPCTGPGGSIALQPGNGFLFGYGKVLLSPIGGLVGIGTNSPTELLHISGSGAVRIMGDVTTLSGSERVDFFARNSQFNTEIGGMSIQRQSSTGDIDTRFFAAPSGGSATERMRIRGSGNVGIGNATPNARLQVTGGDVYVDTQSNGVILRATNGTNCYRLTVNNSGTLSTALVTCP